MKPPPNSHFDEWLKRNSSATLCSPNLQFEKLLHRWKIVLACPMKTGRPNDPERIQQNMAVVVYSIFSQLCNPDIHHLEARSFALLELLNIGDDARFVQSGSMMLLLPHGDVCKCTGILPSRTFWEIGLEWREGSSCTGRLFTQKILFWRDAAWLAAVRTLQKFCTARGVC